MQETQVRSLGGEDPLEKEMATHSSILAWEIPRTEKPGGHSPWGRKRMGPNLGTNEQFGLVIILHDYTVLIIFL